MDKKELSVLFSEIGYQVNAIMISEHSGIFSDMPIPMKLILKK